MLELIRAFVIVTAIGIVAFLLIAWSDNRAKRRKREKRELSALVGRMRECDEERRSRIEGRECL